MEHKNYNEEVIHQVIDVAQRYAQAVAEELQATYDPDNLGAKHDAIARTAHNLVMDLLHSFGNEFYEDSMEDIKDDLLFNIKEDFYSKV